MSSAVPAPAAQVTPAGAPVAPAPAPAPARGAGAITVAGQALAVAPGQALAARVVAAQDGLIELALAGGRIAAESDLPLEPGQTLRLVVADAAPGRVTLRLPPDGPAPGGGGAPATLTAAGLPPAAAASLLAALADASLEPPAGAALEALGARAAAAGVATPAQAAAFARLAAADLPTTPAAVAGLAQLLDGAPLGRALAGLVEAALRQGGALGGGSGQAPIGVSQTPDGAPAQAPGGTPPAALPELAAALSRAAESVEEAATSGQADRLRHALAQLGTGLEHRLAAGSAPETAPVRALLLALAAHPAADASLARAASGLADALAAQGLAGQALPAPAGDAPAGTGNGAYLQVPLPGGGTAEVRVAPDGGGTDAQGRGRPRRLAFLLHLSALGPVMIEATAGPGGVDATVRASGEPARRFLEGRVAELADSLRHTAGGARVSVDRPAGPAPERLLAPPPSSGLDARA